MEIPPPERSFRCMHMRLPSLRVCRYIAERRTGVAIRHGLAVAALVYLGDRTHVKVPRRNDVERTVPWFRPPIKK